MPFRFLEWIFSLQDDNEEEVHTAIGLLCIPIVFVLIIYSLLHYQFTFKSIEKGYKILKLNGVNVLAYSISMPLKFIATLVFTFFTFIYYFYSNMKILIFNYHSNFYLGSKGFTLVIGKYIQHNFKNFVSCIHFCSILGEKNNSVHVSNIHNIMAQSSKSSDNQCITKYTTNYYSFNCKCFDINQESKRFKSFKPFLKQKKKIASNSNIYN